MRPSAVRPSVRPSVRGNSSLPCRPDEGVFLELNAALETALAQRWELYEGRAMLQRLEAYRPETGAGAGGRDGDGYGDCDGNGDGDGGRATAGVAGRLGSDSSSIIISSSSSSSSSGSGSSSGGSSTKRSAVLNTTTNLSLGRYY